MNAEQRLIEAGYDDVVIFHDFSYDDALIGVSTDNRAVYDYSRMVDWLIEKQGFTQDEAMEWIDYNTLRALPYGGDSAPIVIYPLCV